MSFKHSVFRTISGALLAAAPLAAAPFTAAEAQTSPSWFVPSQPAAPAASAPRPAASRQAPRREPPPAPPTQPMFSPQAAASGGDPEVNQPLPKLPEPPVPDVPAQPKGAPPPAAVVGVIGVPEIMRASTAAQQIEKVIGQRRDRLSQDAQRAQLSWREMQQSLINDRAKLSGDQVRDRERSLQERVTSEQKQLRDRNRVIQEAAQVALGQIERELVQVIRVVADSRGMNLVLHRSQVALNVSGFDISPQVADVLNKTLPSVMVTPEGVDPALQVSQTTPVPPAKTAAATPSGK